MTKWPSCSMAVGNQIFQFKLRLLSNLNYGGEFITVGICVSHSGWKSAGQLCEEQPGMRVHNYLTVGCQDGPVVEELRVAFASDAGLSPYSFMLRFKP